MSANGSWKGGCGHRSRLGSNADRKLREKDPGSETSFIKLSSAKFSSLANEADQAKLLALPPTRELGVRSYLNLKRHCSFELSSNFREIWNSASRNAAARKSCSLVCSKAPLSAPVFREHKLALLRPQSVTCATSGGATSATACRSESPGCPSSVLMKRARSKLALDVHLRS